jgi:3-oxoacyl-[acyl-carrier protein] reductase
MKRVLLTGGSQGIGYAIKCRFEESGFEVIAPSRSELDLAHIDSVKKFIELNRDEYFDVLINNAGINDINFIEDVTDDELFKMMQVNLIAPIMLIRGFVGKMKELHSGRIVNIGSIWGIVSKEKRCVYSATKNGIHGVTRALAVELAPYNILVNTVCPGYTLTELTRKNNSPNEITNISEQIPIGRMAEPKEIAELVYFLGCGMNTYVTGQEIAADGGFTQK